MTPVIERIWRRIDRSDPDGCWIWPGRTNTGGGYGVVTVGGRKNPKSLLVHRVVWVHERGPIPPDVECDHLCRNRRCCNPHHIELVPKRVNILRGAGRAAENARKTHCPANHEYTPENTYTYGRRRYCRQCVRKKQRERYHLRKK